MTVVYQNLKPRAKDNFVTDTSIKNKKKPQLKKELVQYTVGDNEKLYTGNLNDEVNEKWNQFELNQKKFNVSSTYNENNYTTELHQELIPEEHKIKTQMIVNEIMKGDNNKNETNIHILEDRGFVNENDYDEEDKYSSVFRK